MMDDRPPEHGASVDDGLPEDTWREWNCFIKATATSYSSDDIFSYILLLFYDVYVICYFHFNTSVYFVTAPDDDMLGGPINYQISNGALFVIAGASLLVI